MWSYILCLFYLKSFIICTYVLISNRQIVWQSKDKPELLPQKRKIRKKKGENQLLLIVYRLISEVYYRFHQSPLKSPRIWLYFTISSITVQDEISSFDWATTAAVCASRTMFGTVRPVAVNGQWSLRAVRSTVSRPVDF